MIVVQLAKDFSFGLYELDWNVFNKHADEMVKLVPKLAKTGIKSTVCGPESFTPDHKPLMGMPTIKTIRKSKNLFSDIFFPTRSKSKNFDLNL